MQKLLSLLLLSLIVLPTSAQLQFKSNDRELNKAFLWAREKALSYAHKGDPVGPWYEAALPDRAAFCMRDVSHQSMGAAMLGLREHNRNMFLKFAQNISESKDYCSYWEINKFDEPAPVDFRNDKDFWYNLPANFDVIYNCYRQYLWTGDSMYLLDKAFQNFYQKSLNKYVERWQLGHEKVLLRSRLLNLQQPPVRAKSFFHTKRGIPTYNEGGRGETVLGIDMTASLIAAYLAYAEMLKMTGEEVLGVKYRLRALAEHDFMERFWWDSEKKSFRSILYENGQFDGFMVGKDQAFLHYLLYFDVLYDQQQKQAIVDAYAENHDSLIVELKSYLPIIFYENGHFTLANQLVKYLCSEENKRRDYPENSFTIIEHLVSGFMGIKADASERKITTINRMDYINEWAKMDDLPVFQNTISISHEGTRASSFTNTSGEKLTWRVGFQGKINAFKVNGKPFKGKIQFEEGISFIEIRVAEGEQIHVNAQN